jgi:transposase
MTQKRVHFPRTTAQQRRLLFETWEATGNIAQACRKAHGCRQTFYNWKPRFEAGGYAALAEFASHAPKEPHGTSPEIEERVIATRRQNLGWGKRRIADELAKGNNWVALVSPNTVKRILQDAGLWTEGKTPAKKGGFKP